MKNSNYRAQINSNLHLIRRKSLPTNDFELTVPDLYCQCCVFVKTPIGWDQWCHKDVIQILQRIKMILYIAQVGSILSSYKKYDIIFTHFVNNKLLRRNNCCVSVLCLQALFSILCFEFNISVLKYWLFFNKMHME